MKRLYGLAVMTGLMLAAVPAMPVQAAKSVTPLIQGGCGESCDDYSRIAVSNVSNYVNVRSAASTDGNAVGKIYNNAAATILETVEGEGGSWYKIQSGAVTGYIKAEYFLTGDAAAARAAEAGKPYAKVSVDSTLRLREGASTDSNVLELLSSGTKYPVIGEQDNFYQIKVNDNLSGYVSKDYVRTEVDLPTAVAETGTAQSQEQPSGQSGESRAAQSGQAQDAPREAAQAEAPAAPAQTTEVKTQPGETAQVSQSAGAQARQQRESNEDEEEEKSRSSASGADIVAYAKKFIGNPYVYGGTSLTDGCDCSGFTMKVLAHFGISTGRSSRDQADRGKSVPVSEVQPGDLLFYGSGDYINHVALYIGNGQIVHASTPATGIKISNYDYRTPTRAVTFLR